MFIDIHAHAYRRPTPFVTRFYNPEELIQRYDELGIEKGELKKAKETALSLAEMGLSVDKIAQAVKINVDTVREWIDGNV